MNKPINQSLVKVGNIAVIKTYSGEIRRRIVKVINGLPVLANLAGGIPQDARGGYIPSRSLYEIDEIFEPTENYVDPQVKPVTVKSMKSFAFLVARDGTINATVNGKNYTLPPDSMFYNAAKQALKDKDAEGFVIQCDLEASVRERSRGQIQLVDGVILWNGNPIHNAITQRIFALIKDDFPFEPLLKFLENTLKNPEQRAVDELYLFLEANTLPITEDGCFLAYRRVGANYESLHANPDGTRNSNRPGETVTMKRSDCDHRRNETCSRGLHFCSIGYLPSYGGAKTVIVKINPADVVSIPHDYNNQKGRCCKYEVVDEYLPNDNKEVLNEAAVYEVTPVTEATPTGVKPSGQKYHAKRGPDGRWAK